MNRIVLILCLSLITPLLPHTHSDHAGPHRNSKDHKRVCNQDGSLCLNAAMDHSLVQNPLYFKVHVRCADQVDLGWELRDDSGKILDQDPDGRLAFLVSKASASERTLAVRDYALAPAKSSHGRLVLHATAYSTGNNGHALPEFSIPVRLDTRITKVAYAVPVSDEFADAVTDNVESDPAHPVPMQAPVQWNTATLLYVKPATLGGAAAEAAARACGGQGPWHVINYRMAKGTAHLTIIGDGWAGVTYYLTGLDYLLEKTEEHRPGVRHVVFDPHPDFPE